MKLLPSRTTQGGFSFRLPRLFGRRQKGFQRRHERYTCEIPGTMTVLETGAKFDGLILEISAGGCSFRPASLYLLNRVGSEVSIGTEHFSVTGLIRATRPHSYGIEFSDELTNENMAQLMMLYGSAKTDPPLAA